MQCIMDHIVLNVEDVEKMVDFYTTILKFSPERLIEYRTGVVPFPSVRLNANTIIDLFPNINQPKDSSTKQTALKLNHFCIALSKGDWEKLLERLQANGVNIEDGPTSRWGAHGDGISIYFRDPEGTLVEARYYENNLAV